VLPPGRYAFRNLLGGPDGAALRVNRDGWIRGYVPVTTIGPRVSLVLDLLRQDRGAEGPSQGDSGGW